MERQCIVCGKTFIKSPTCSNKEWEKHIYCSHRCYYNTLKGKVFHRPFGNTSRRGKKMSDETKEKLRQNNLKNPRRYWLGKKRSQETIDKIKLTIGLNPRFREKGGNWRGGTARIADCIRAGVRGSAWVACVLNRDNYTCQKCKNKGVVIAHHIKSFSDILHENNVTTVEQAEDCNELYDIDNGITFCWTCHTAFHHTYGKGKNNRDQLEQFLTNNSI